MRNIKIESAVKLFIRLTPKQLADIKIECDNNSQIMYFGKILQGKMAKLCPLTIDIPMQMLSKTLSRSMGKNAQP